MSSATAFGYSSLYISWYEQQGKGLQWADIWTSPVPNDTMNYGYTIIIMILDGFVYGILGWYVKNVFPSQYGASQPFYFILTPKFWKSTIVGRIFCQQNSQPNSNEYIKDSSFKKANRKANKNKYIEQEPDLHVGISIKDMSRKFKEKTVVNNLTLNFFEGQITALLGHNGAGKSTTM
jgi:ABC-type multidrug transport system fused ATPase/permease subunit